nr:MAG TPA: hypothetical protein [Caudoviricetes sp.]
MNKCHCVKCKILRCVALKTVLNYGSKLLIIALYKNLKLIIKRLFLFILKHINHQNKSEMNKNIVVKKEKPFCQLDGLPGVKRRKVDAYWINDTIDIEPTLELGYACTSSGNNGAINVWKDDTGMIRGELMRHLVVVEKRTFVSYEEVEKCVRDWLDRIN